jgi:hypothetical protein
VQKRSLRNPDNRSAEAFYSEHRLTCPMFCASVQLVSAVIDAFRYPP